MLTSRLTVLDRAGYLSDSTVGVSKTVLGCVLSTVRGARLGVLGNGRDCVGTDTDSITARFKLRLRLIMINLLSRLVMVSPR